MLSIKTVTTDRRIRKGSRSCFGLQGINMYAPRRRLLPANDGKNAPIDCLDCSEEVLRERGLRMVGLNAKIGKQELFAGWFWASALGLDGYEDCVNLLKRFRVIGLHYPAFVRGAIHVEDAEVR